MFCTSTKKFETTEKRWAHYEQEHFELQKYSCATCKKAFKLQGDMFKHFLCEHSTSEYQEIFFRFKCMHCTRRFETVEKRSEHYKQEHLELQRYKCLPCEILFKCKKEMDDHFLNVHGHYAERKFKCFCCEQTFGTITQRKTHFQIVHQGVNNGSSNSIYFDHIDSGSSTRPITIIKNDDHIKCESQTISNATEKAQTQLKIVEGSTAKSNVFTQARMGISEDKLDDESKIGNNANEPCLSNSESIPHYKLFRQPYLCIF